MGLTYGFYNGTDRKYHASQMSSLFDGIINDGVFMSIGDTLMVSASEGMNIIVGPGRAWFDHTWTNNDAELILTVELSETILDRIDTVVLEVNNTDEVRANNIKIIKGVPSSVPEASTLVRNEWVNQYPLATISIAAKSAEVTAANITNMVGTSGCPFITGILETMNIDALVVQWESQWNNELTSWSNQLTSWGTDFHSWFTTLRDILDENVAGNILNLMSAATKVKNNITIYSEGWIDDTAVSGFWIYDIIDPDITEDSVVDVNIHLLDLEKASSLKSANDSIVGKTTIYSEDKPTENIVCDLKLVRQVV